MRQVKTLGLLGTGVIGGGWAARALHFGIDVVAADVKPEMEEWIRGAVANAEGALAQLTFAPLPPKGKLTFTTDLRAMAAQVDFIQENIPEQLELKQRVLADVSRVAPDGCVIASSTSGLMPTRPAEGHGRPRALPGGPSVQPGVPAAAGGAGGWQAHLGGCAGGCGALLHLHRHACRSACGARCPGHLTDRLQEAIWREILHMVNEDVATTGELDDSIIYGPGLRWAAMGTNLIYHLAGGETGMRHMLQAVRAVPEVAVDQARGAGADRRADRQDGRGHPGAGRRAARSARSSGSGMPTWSRSSRCSRAMTSAPARRCAHWSSGCTRMPAPGRGPSWPRQPAAGAKAGALELLEIEVRPEWIDYNGHMTDSRYLQVFGDATDAVFRFAGIDDAYRKAGRPVHGRDAHDPPGRGAAERAAVRGLARARGG